MYCWPESSILMPVMLTGTQIRSALLSFHADDASMNSVDESVGRFSEGLTEKLTYSPLRHLRKTRRRRTLCARAEGLSVGIGKNGRLEIELSWGRRIR